MYASPQNYNELVNSAEFPLCLRLCLDLVSFSFSLSLCILCTCLFRRIGVSVQEKRGGVRIYLFRIPKERYIFFVCVSSCACAYACACVCVCDGAWYNVNAQVCTH